eukprot:5443607-Karenia_brevis.AAC.1
MSAGAVAFEPDVKECVLFDGFEKVEDEKGGMEIEDLYEMSWAMSGQTHEVLWCPKLVALVERQKVGKADEEADRGYEFQGSHLTLAPSQLRG